MALFKSCPNPNLIAKGLTDFSLLLPDRFAAIVPSLSFPFTVSSWSDLVLTLDLLLVSGNVREREAKPQSEDLASKGSKYAKRSSSRSE